MERNLRNNKMLGRNITSEGKEPIKTYKRRRNITSAGKEAIITYKRRRVSRRAIPDVPGELITEILLRLPVKSLARFKSVCKAWRIAISDPFFVRSHLLHSASKQEQQPSFLITPRKLDTVIDDEDWPTTFSNNASFFQWQYGKDNMRLLHAKDFDGEFHSVGLMSHCDGLVLFPTDTTVYVINPATGDVLRLPEGQKDATSPYFPSVGFGFDPRSNTHKIARYFYRSVNHTMQTYDAGMEVFTIGQDGGDCWREIAESPPYPLRRLQIAVHCKGSLIWTICEMLAEPDPHVLLRFSLEDEKFSLIPYPCTSLPFDQYISSQITQINGELCLNLYTSDHQEIWIYNGDQWDQRYIISTLNTFGSFHPLAILSDHLVVQADIHLCHHSSSSEKLTEVTQMEQLKCRNPCVGDLAYPGENAYFFNVLPYTESLIQVGKPR